MGYPDDGRIGGNATADRPISPVQHIANRLNATLVTAEERIMEVVQATHRAADRLSGEQGPAKGPEVSPTRVQPDMGPPTGHNGVIGEIEAVVLRAEALLADMATNLERAINRITKVV